MKKLHEKMRECIDDARGKFPELKEDMIAIVNGDSMTAVVVEEIYEDGFKGHLPFSELSVYYSTLPFTTVDDVLLKHVFTSMEKDTDKIN